MGVDVAAELSKALYNYSDEVVEAANEVVEELAQEAVSELKTAGDFHDRTGKYRKGWAKKKGGRKLGIQSYVVYNKKAPQLTHLLEKGHVKRGGVGRVRAYPHIAPLEESLDAKVKQKMKEKLG